MTNGNGHLQVDQGTAVCKEPSDSTRVVKVENAKMLAQCWSYVEKGLENIKKKDEHAGNWIPKHVRMRIIQGFAKPPQSMVELWLAVDVNNVMHGFIVTDTLVDPFLNLPWTLYIWAGHLNRKQMKRFAPWLKQLALDRGLANIEFDSSRLGWMGALRRMEGLSFQIKTHRYSMRVD